MCIRDRSEEAKDGRRGPGRAMMASLAIVGALFVLQTYICLLYTSRCV